MKPMQWLRNKLWLLDLAGGRTCSKSSRRFAIQGTFTKQSVLEFNASCSPSAFQVFRRAPVPGEAVARFSGSCPLPLYSAKNRSDGPSRGRPVDPRTKEQPLWLSELAVGKTFLFDLVCASACVPKLAARWLGFLLLLGGDIKRHPGPPLRPRGALDLESGFATSTRQKMTKALDAFTVWLETTLLLSFAAAMSSAHTAALALRGFGLHLYASDYPRYLLVPAITGVQNAFPEFRSRLTPAWQIDKNWQQVEPG